MTEPTTAAGRALLEAEPEDVWLVRDILAIEAEARAAGAEEAFDGYRAVLGLEIPGERMSKNHLDAALARVEGQIGRKARAAALDDPDWERIWQAFALVFSFIPDTEERAEVAKHYAAIDALREGSGE